MIKKNRHFFPFFFPILYQFLTIYKLYKIKFENLDYFRLLIHDVTMYGLGLFNCVFIFKKFFISKKKSNYIIMVNPKYI
jgi:hypothetical protein